MLNINHGFIRNLYDILTKELTWEDLNKSVNDDMRGMYEFYARSMKSVEEEKNKFKRALKFIYHLFIAFLLKLSPARRFMYAIAIVFIMVSIIQGKPESAVYAFLIINLLLAMELADKLTTKDELTIAREIQLSLQPINSKIITGYDISSFSEVAKQVGGDFYDIIKTSNNDNLIAIGDVSGKGISSALYVVKIQTALQLFAKETDDLKLLLVKLNSHLYGQLKRNYFLTLFLLKLNNDGKVEYCRAGHPPALHYKASIREISWLQPNGIAIGMAPSYNGIENNGAISKTSFYDAIELGNTLLDKNDILFLFTDGVSESISKEGKEFSEEKIADIIKLYAEENVNVIQQHLYNMLTKHRSGADLRDDTTFILIKRI